MGTFVIESLQKEVIKWHIKALAPCQVVYTNFTVKIIKGKDKFIFSEMKIDKKGLILINMVKNSIKTIGVEKLPEYKTEEIRFNGAFYPRDYSGFIYEIDANSFYWQLAIRDGLLLDYAINWAKQCSKHDRLIAIGAPGKIETIFEYEDENNRRFIEEIQWKEGRIFSNYIRKTASDIMYSISKEIDGILFYWVDAFFVTSGAEKVQKLLKAHGFESKVIVHYGAKMIGDGKYQVGEKTFSLPVKSSKPII